MENGDFAWNYISAPFRLSPDSRPQCASFAACYENRRMKGNNDNNETKRNDQTERTT